MNPLLLFLLVKQRLARLLAYHHPIEQLVHVHAGKGLFVVVDKTKPSDATIFRPGVCSMITMWMMTLFPDLL